MALPKGRVRRENAPIPTPAEIHAGLVSFSFKYLTFDDKFGLPDTAVKATYLSVLFDRLKQISEFARDDVNTNSIEGFFGMIRRGLDGIYHSVSHKHLHRYLSEFEFRHNYRELGDGARIKQAIRSANNKRLLYKEVTGAE